MTPDPHSIFTTLKTAFDNGKQISKFLRDDMVKILNVIGDNELAAAIRSFENLKEARDFRRELTNALSHLQSAFEHFYSNASKKGWKAWLNDNLDSLRFHENERGVQGYQKASETAYLIGLCYGRLGEERLMHKYLDTAADCRKELCLARIHARRLRIENSLRKPTDAEKERSIAEGLEDWKEFAGYCQQVILVHDCTFSALKGTGLDWDDIE